MQFSWAIIRNRTMPLLIRSYSSITGNLPAIKVISDKEEEFIKLSFKMNQPHYLNIKALKTEEVRTVISKIKLMAALQRKKEEIRQSISTKYSGAVQLALKNDEEIDICLIQDEKEIDEHVTNDKAWTSGSYLKIGDLVYEIKCNHPTVLSQSLPDCIVAGCIIRVHVILESANIFDCDFSWYHNLTEAEVKKLDQHILNSDSVLLEDEQYWFKVGKGLFYQTTEKDIDRCLKVVCVPRSGDIFGERFSSNSVTNIERGPEIFPFEERHAFTKNLTDNHSIRCVSYNILAKNYVEKRKFPYCSPKARDIYYRKQLLIKELLGYHSDIICLQEVTERLFDLDLKLILQSAGYDGFYMRKGGRRYEGLATFFRKDKFRVLNNHGILLNVIVKEKEIFIDLLSKVSGNYKDMSKLLAQDTAYQAIMLEDLTPQKHKVLVANTHLYSNKDTPDVRLLQSALCSCYTEHILKTEGDQSTGVLFCGDFNSLPDSTTYQFLTSGNFECCPSWKNNKTELAASDLDTTLRHNLLLASACGTPDYTNYTQEFKGCLDYIFYNTDCLSVADIVPMPNHEKVSEQVGLPNDYFPSDHLALVCTLKWKTGTEL